MRKLISIILLTLISVSILAESTATIEKEVSGVNKNTITEERELVEGQEKEPTVEKVEINLIDTDEEKLKKEEIGYSANTNSTEELSEDLAKPRTKPNYWVWGLGILAIVAAGFAIGSK